VDRCAGQCDDEVSHDDLCEPSALLEPTPTEANASLKGMAEPTKCPRPQDWALVVRCAGQCDDEVSHDDLCEPSALLEPTPMEANASLKEMAEPTK